MSTHTQMILIALTEKVNALECMYKAMSDGYHRDEIKNELAEYSMLLKATIKASNEQTR